MSSISDSQFEAFLDGQLPEAESLEVRQALASDSLRTEQAALQAEIDTSLRRQFSPPPPDADWLAGLEGQVQSANDGSSQTTSHRYRPVLWGIAAAIIWMAVLYQVFGPRDDATIAFVQRPLVDIYHETVDQGFQPYWDCRNDAERFAETFFARQGRRLQLESLPAGREMVGLSYLAGLSRQTTAMLARVDGQPVLVFVDRLENDRSVPPADPASDLQQFRKEYAGLVLYEVTPLDKAEFLDALR